MTVRGDHRGFTVVEAAIAAALMVPLLGAVFASTKMLVGSVEENDHTSEVMQVARTAAQRIGRRLQAARRTTIKTSPASTSAPALTTDTTSWITMPQLDPKDSIELQSAGGNLAKESPVTQFEFVLDANETDNDIDDDGDGIVDEGTVWARFDGEAVPVVSGVETCTFELDGKLLRFVLVCARRDEKATVRRASVANSVFLRNQ